MVDLVPVDHDPFADVPTNYAPATRDPFATPKPGQQVPATPNPDMMSREAAGNAVSTLRPFWMDMEPTDREIVERGNAMQTGQTGPGKVLPTTGMNPVPFAALDIGSMLPVGGMAKLAGAALGAGAKGALKVAAEEVAPKVAQGIRAYHASPHDFNAFDLSHIGTGEGAQAYGHGLYFAENPAVTDEYLKAFKGRGKLPDDILSLPPEMRQAVTTHARTDVDAATAAKRAQYMSANLRNTDVAKVEDMIQRVRDAERGRTYEVNINANPEHFLDWDKPLSEQHAAKVRDVANTIKPNLWERISETGRDLARWGLTENLEGKTGEAVIATLNRAIGSDQKVTEALREAGIPGIKYLDQGSRQPKTLFNGQPIPSDNPTARLAAEKLDLHGSPDKAIASLENDATQGHPYIRQSSADAAALLKNGTVARSTPQGTSNYVLFDDKLIDIVKKYGIAGLGVFPAGSHFLQQVDGDPFAKGHAAGGRVGKLSHKAVGYIPQSRTKNHCGVCSMFREGPHCVLVADPINPAGWCRRFDPKAN